MRSKSFKFVAMTALLALASACTTLPKPGTPESGQKDPLVGQIFDVRTGTAVAFADLVDRLSAHDVIYLSEKHDNPMHHAIQHRIIQQLTEKGLRPSVGFEFFSKDQTPLLLSFVDSRNADHSPKVRKAVKERMRKKLDWEDQSDTMWDFYYDLLDLARQNGLWAAGLDLDESLKRRITRKGMEGITPLEKARLFSTNLEDPAYEARMKDLFKQVHCGMDRGTETLYQAWLARNDQMALSVAELHAAGLKADPVQGPVVVIVGNGHTEFGLGLMDRVQKIAPGLSQVNLSLAEVARTPSPLSDYLAPLTLEGHPNALPADFIWFTQRVSNEDPCEKFKKSLIRMKQNQE